MPGPLEGVRVLELAGLGALPYGSLRLADMGADVVRVDRLSKVPASPQPRPYSSWDRGRRSIAVDLKHPDGVATVLRLAEGAHVFMEAFRPGVVERLGVGPEQVMAVNPAIVYARLTGWGQTGPLSQVAGHSLNYEALTGLIRAIGPAGGPPVPLLQVMGDFAGGGLTMAYGVVCALWESSRSGKGQVIDVAMTDGVASLAGVFYGMSAAGMHSDEMGSNLFDGGAPFYSIYECADGKYLSVAPIEPHFYKLLLDLIGLGEADDLPDQYDRARWPELKARLAEVFAQKTRDEWADLLAHTDACVAPVLTFDEAAAHPHHLARGTFTPLPNATDQAANDAADPAPNPDAVEVAPVPPMSRTPGQAATTSPTWPGQNTDEVLTEAGFTPQEIANLRQKRAIAG